MTTAILLVGWCALLVLSWPVAIALLILAPLIWLLSLPFRLLGAIVNGVLAFVRAIFMLPARLLGHRP